MFARGDHPSRDSISSIREFHSNVCFAIGWCWLSIQIWRGHEGRNGMELGCGLGWSLGWGWDGLGMEFWMGSGWSLVWGLAWVTTPQNIIIHCPSLSWLAPSSLPLAMFIEFLSLGSHAVPPYCIVCKAPLIACGGNELRKLVRTCLPLDRGYEEWALRFSCGHDDLKWNSIVVRTWGRDDLTLDEKIGAPKVSGRWSFWGIAKLVLAQGCLKR
jgi:hypothetical protein